MKQALTQTLSAGALATLLMTLILYLFRSVGIPVLDLAAVLGSVAGGAVPALFSSTWWIGLADHLMLGVLLFPLFYLLAAPMLTDNRAFNGLVLGVLLWSVHEIAVVPFAQSLFALETTQEPLVTGIALSLSSLLLHTVYGVALTAALPAAVPSATQASGDRRVRV